MATRYVYLTTVCRVEERFERINWKKGEGEPTYDEVSLGWFVSFAGSYESLHVGEKPDIEPGDKIRITLEKVVA